MKKILLASLITGIFILTACAPGAAPESTPTPAENAWNACTSFIQKELTLPIEDAQKYIPAGVTYLAENQYAVVVYYPKQGGTYQCEVLARPDGLWELLDLKAR